MQTFSTNAADIPTALPDIEPDEDRENLLLENQDDLSEDEVESEDLAAETISRQQGSRAGKILRSVAVFTVFLFLMGLAITWFFGMGWFATQKPQSVNRTGQKDTSTAPMTEDEKLTAALTMVASKEPNIGRDSVANQPAEIITVDNPDESAGQSIDIPSMTSSRSRGEPSVTNIDTNTFSKETSKPREESSDARNRDYGPRVKSPQLTQPNTSIEPLSRSLFFGITKARNDVTPVQNAPSVVLPVNPKKVRNSGEIPFGTLLPVRLVGAIYTLKSSGGVVRLELTQSIESKGYSYPAGTVLIGNLRGGESVRAFVSVVGLIDPASGEFVKFSGELMGTDGASGIQGNRKRMTGKWTRFFRSLKDTAGSFLGSVGSFRPGRTVILSDSLRRGSERLSEDTSQSLFGSEREDAFLEVLAGTTGYVLVTQMPEATTVMTVTATGADKE